LIYHYTKKNRNVFKGGVTGCNNTPKFRGGANRVKAQVKLAE